MTKKISRTFDVGYYNVKMYDPQTDDIITRNEMDMFELEELERIDIGVRILKKELVFTEKIRCTLPVTDFFRASCHERLTFEDSGEEMSTTDDAVSS